MAWSTAPVMPTGEVTVQVYVVPAGTTSGSVLVGVTVKAVAEQIVCVTLAITGFGFTVTVTVKVLLHAVGAVPEVAVTVYTTLIAALVVLVKI